MDVVLEQTVKLAYLIRDSIEAEAWRKAWGSFREVRSRTWNPATSAIEEAPLSELFHHVWMGDPTQSRPLLFPLLIVRSLPYLDMAQIQNRLQDQPELWNSYQQLLSCVRLTSLLITFLRSIGPGYPHENLVYTLPNTPWAELSNERELPWNMGDFLLPKGVIDAKLIGLERFLPSVSKQAAVCLNDLVTNIQTDNTWLQLKKSYQKVSRQDNLRKRMQRARSQFEREMSKLNQPDIPKLLWQVKVEELAQKIYRREGAQIMAYVQSFWQFERLIEHIYWLLSQLVIRETISYLTSANHQHIQQISLGCGQERLLTALAPTLAKSLEIGQLIHITLIETNHILDGLYQVTQWIEKYKIATGTRILFRARCLWYCQLDDLLQVTSELIKPAFVPSEEMEVLGESRVDIHGPNEEVVSLRIKDHLLDFELPKTVYLP
jgi:hypothetical protein